MSKKSKKDNSKLKDDMDLPFFIGKIQLKSKTDDDPSNHIYWCGQNQTLKKLFPETYNFPEDEYIIKIIFPVQHGVPVEFSLLCDGIIINDTTMEEIIQDIRENLEAMINFLIINNKIKFKKYYTLIVTFD